MTIIMVVYEEKNWPLSDRGSRTLIFESWADALLLRPNWIFIAHLKFYILLQSRTMYQYERKKASVGEKDSMP